MTVQLVDGDVVEVRVVCHIPEQIAVNRRYFRITNSVGAGIDTDVLASDLDNLLDNPYKVIMPATANYRGISVQRVFPGARTIASVSVALAGAGTAIGGLQPAQVCALGALRTDLAGRKFRGRVYAPFPSDNFQGANGKPTPAFVTGPLQTLTDNWVGTITFGLPPDEADGVSILFKPPSGPQTDITAGIARTEWATQRRRGGFGAQNIVPF